jgi:hypothetical protein
MWHLKSRCNYVVSPTLATALELYDALQTKKSFNLGQTRALTEGFVRTNNLSV